MNYKAEINDMLFNIEYLADINLLNNIDEYQEASLDTAEAVLSEYARYCENEIAPLNAPADKKPSDFVNGSVVTSAGFKGAYEQFVQASWQSLAHPAAYGGQNFPKVISAACAELLHTSNLSFALCPMLTDGAIEALLTAASDEMKNTYLPNLISGKWTGTMNLTEPQAGSDLSLVRSSAKRLDDGSYKVFGTKIFITYGEHDMAENIIHLVLARVEGAPEGIKGISLFVVPKFLVNDDGSLGARNDVVCQSLEHKLGIKASPTAVLQFGDAGGAIGYLVGEENRGLEYMFVMMNSARYAVGVQGIAISQRAYQLAASYAKERVQSRPVDGSSKAPALIIHQPDVRRMLLTMRALTEGSRALACFAAQQHDLKNKEIYEFLVPLVKGFSTEIAQEVTSLGIQIHGGMGYIEETGAAQHFRDARILTIYEGTTAIQSNDFVGRKTVRDAGELALKIAGEIRQTQNQLSKSENEKLKAISKELDYAISLFEKTINFIAQNAKEKPNEIYAASVAYLMLAANIISAWQLSKAAIKANECINKDINKTFMQNKITTALFYAQHILPRVQTLSSTIINGSNSIADIMNISIESL